MIPLRPPAPTSPALLCFHGFFSSFSISTSSQGAIEGHLKDLSRSGKFSDAVSFLQKLNACGIHVSQGTYICIVQDCIYYKAFSQAASVHASIQHNNVVLDINLGNTLINMYIKDVNMERARMVFEDMAERNVFTWTLVIGGCTKLGYRNDALLLFWRMIEEDNVRPNKYTFLAVVKSCHTLEQCQQIHACMVTFRLDSNDFMRSSLIDMYARCGSIVLAQEVFYKTRVDDVVTWNSMISAYVQVKQDELALGLFYQLQQEGLVPDDMTFVCILKSCIESRTLEQGLLMHCCINERRPHVAIENALIEMYTKCESFASAFRVFSRMSEPNVISWTSMVEGLIHNGFSEEALSYFWQMQSEKVMPDYVAYVSAIRACANLAVLEFGKQVHDCMVKHGFKQCTFLENTLIDMYAKCGSMEFAYHVFDHMHERDMISWSAMVSGFALHGNARKALLFVEEMCDNGMILDHVTSVGVLSACSHAGLIEDAVYHFGSIIRNSNLKPTAEHYACMVSMLTRAGRLGDAIAFIHESDCPCGEEIWTSVLTTCRSFGEITLAKHVSMCLLHVKPESTAAFVLLSNIYAEVGKWKERAMVRKAMGAKCTEALEQNPYYYLR